jgi:hypothetical protein
LINGWCRSGGRVRHVEQRYFHPGQCCQHGRGEWAANRIEV